MTQNNDIWHTQALTPYDWTLMARTPCLELGRDGYQREDCLRVMYNDGEPGPILHRHGTLQTTYDVHSAPGACIGSGGTVAERGRLQDYACVRDRGVVTGTACVRGTSSVAHGARVADGAVVTGATIVTRSAEVLNSAFVRGGCISGKTRIIAGVHVGDPLLLDAGTVTDAGQYVTLTHGALTAFGVVRLTIHPSYHFDDIAVSVRCDASLLISGISTRSGSYPYHDFLAQLQATEYSEARADGIAFVQHAAAPLLRRLGRISESVTIDLSARRLTLPPSA